MSRRHTTVPFTTIFTSADLATAGLSRGVLVTWLRYGEVHEVAEGVYLPAHLPVTAAVRRIWRDRATALGAKPVSVAGAADVHGLWTPPEVPAFLHRTNRKLALPDDCIERHGPLVVPSAAWTAIQLTRGQELPGALIPLDSALRAGISHAELRSLASRIDGWSGTRALRAALQHCTSQSGSPLESYSRGIMIERGVPEPTLQHEFRIAGRHYFTDFAWAAFNSVGEADGDDKYRREGAVSDEKRRQGALHSVGIHVLRWGWPEVLQKPVVWASGLIRALESNRSAAA